MRLRGTVDDPHLLFALFVVEGIRDQEQRLRWVKEWLPRTAAYLGLMHDWEDLSDGLPDGTGAMTRPNPAA